MRQYVDQRLVVDKRCGCIDKELELLSKRVPLFVLLANLNYSFLNAE